MNINMIPGLLNMAKSTIVDLVSTGNDEERRQALDIKQILERNQAAYIQAGKVSSNSHEARVFIATHKKLFEATRKLRVEEVEDFNYKFFCALFEETEVKEKELFLYTKGLAEIVKQNIPDDAVSEDIFERYSEITKDFDTQSATLLMFFLKYYWCEKALEYFAEVNNFDKKQPVILSDELNGLSKRMKDDLSKITFIVALEGKEVKSFQKILDLSNNFVGNRFAKKRFARMEAYLHKKLDQTMALITLSMAEEIDK